MWRINDNKSYKSSCKVQAYPKDNGELLKGIFNRENNSTFIFKIH